ncbi:MAG: OmpH family outer membrane protein [Alphaproteobacteria bacterium]|nr:OmpH family outer membrane protein [Alphaproteobacteria bacterium]
MSQISRIFLFGFTLLLLLGAASAVMAQEKTSIAVVDVEKILAESKAGKDLQKRLKTKREAFQKEFSERENMLMKAEKDLVQEKAKLSQEEFLTKRKEFEKQLLETRNLFQKRRSALDRGVANALKELRKNIFQVTAEVADEFGYKVVLTRSSVVIVEKNIEITDKVLKRLDDKIQTLSLDIAQ